MNGGDIFRDIETLIFEHTPDSLEISDGHKRFIRNFLQHHDASSAAQLFNFIHRVQEKEPLYNLLKELRRYERNFLDIVPENREHFVHSASVYVLGLGIYNASNDFRQAVITERHQPDSTHAQKTSFLFRWSLAACLHDLAYPLELNIKSFNKYSKRLHGIDDENCSFLTINHDIYELFNILPIIKPDSGMSDIQRDTALGLIANFLTSKRNRNSRVTYDTLLTIIERYLKNGLDSGQIDHGAFSAFVLLKLVHDLYEKSDWDIRNFYYEVVDSATAIFLHNAYKYSMLRDIYGEGKYKYDSPSPLGYLLYFCDSICEWLRSESSRKDFKLFRITVADDRINFRIHKSFEAKIEESAALFDKRAPVRIEYFGTD
jgi:hypothetical protein